MQTVRRLTLLLALLTATAVAAPQIPEEVDETPDAVDTVCPERFQVAAPAGPLAVACRWNKAPGVRDTDVTRVIVVIHGILRNADSYYEAVKRIADALNGAADSTLIIAPQFLTEADIEAHDLADDVLFWTSGGWKQGDQSLSTERHTRAGAISSFAVVDQMLMKLADPETYPRLREMVIIGHSAGGQFVNRYMAGSRAEETYLAPKGIAARYIVANPSSYLYLTPSRRVPAAGNEFAELTGHRLRHNRYPYGLDAMNAYMNAAGADAITKHVRERDVIYLCGAEDDDPKSPLLDTSVSARMQGANRWERAVTYHQHLRETLGPEISRRHKFLKIPGAGHRAWDIFRSASGVKYLFGRTSR